MCTLTPCQQLPLALLDKQLIVRYKLMVTTPMKESVSECQPATARVRDPTQLNCAVGQGKQVCHETMRSLSLFLLHLLLLIIITAPGPVSKLSYARLTNTSVVISWEPPQQPRGVIAAYFLIQLGFGGVFTTAEHFIKLDNLGECGMVVIVSQ